MSSPAKPVQYVFPISKFDHYRFPTHTNDLVMDRSQAKASEAFIVVLEPGEAPPRHQHDDTEQLFYVMEGQGRLEIGSEPQCYEVKPGDLVRIPVSAPHRIFCTGQTVLRYLAIDCFPAGRPTAEPTWDSHVRVLCRNNAWDYDKVRSR